MAKERLKAKKDCGIHHHARYDPGAALQRNAVESVRATACSGLRRKKDGNVWRRSSCSTGTLSQWRAGPGWSVAGIPGHSSPSPASEKGSQESRGAPFLAQLNWGVGVGIWQACCRRLTRSVSKCPGDAPAFAGRPERALTNQKRGWFPCAQIQLLFCR